RPFIFAERNGIHIIDLAQTVKRLDAALDFVRDTVARGDTILFVGTKKQAQEPIAEEATRAEMPYVNQRWLGGMLTNFVTIRKRIGLLDQLDARQQNGEFERLSKKEASGLMEEQAKLQRTLGGIRKMRRLPGAMFVIDPQREHIAVTEARKLEIPVIGTGDTNVDPDMLDYVVPANDDAIRAIRLLCSLIADAAVEGGHERAVRPVEEPVAIVEEQEEASDEMVAALAAGGTFSFEPEPDEEELLPADRAVETEETEDDPEAASVRAAPARPAPRTGAARPGAPRTGPKPGAKAAAKPATRSLKDKDKKSDREEEEASE
ncbi:MAG TPA: 30S ribosomal protein S2, partial [Candidatus Limnocylindria bacterium]|nr:30S ribosomal protein S2 [Candidatus Limnocylindria bacterium]